MHIKDKIEFFIFYSFDADESSDKRFVTSQNLERPITPYI